LAEKRITRKELLKEPDEFLTTTGEVIRYARENPRRVIAGSVVLVVCLVAAFGFYGYHRQQLSRSFDELDKAVRAYDALDQTTAPVPKETLSAALAQFDRVSKDYASLPAGQIAVLYSGHVLYKMEDYKAALERYERMQTTAMAKAGLGQLIAYHSAMTRLALKDYDQARALFTQLTTETDSPYRREAAVSIARIYELTGQHKEAAQAYRQYLKMFPEAPDAAFIRARLAELAPQA
jgi:tetratricopeptide (TPR) repeat protein